MIPVKEKIISIEDFLPIRRKLTSEAKKLVFSNGCFDILHMGHVDYLERAKNLGDHLVLGLNTDRSIGALKGAERPVQDQESRARVMASLFFVDHVILFDEETPFDLISAILPDILVKGNDYRIENIVGSDVVIAHGGRVETIPLVKGYSTSKIISTIKNQSK
jgi:D-glycero-beta-D-manno-heptose 1-phosphate adenylyltransferase